MCGRGGLIRRPTAGVDHADFVQLSRARDNEAVRCVAHAQYERPNVRTLKRVRTDLWDGVGGGTHIASGCRPACTKSGKPSSALPAPASRHSSSVHTPARGSHVILCVAVVRPKYRASCVVCPRESVTSRRATAPACGMCAVKRCANAASCSARVRLLSRRTSTTVPGLSIPRSL